AKVTGGAGRPSMGQSGKTGRSPELLMKQVPGLHVPLQAWVKQVRAAEVELLVGGIQIVIRQQHRRAEELVAQKRAVVLLPEEVTGKRDLNARIAVNHGQAAGIRRPPERPGAEQRRELADRDRRKGRVERRVQR